MGPKRCRVKAKIMPYTHQLTILGAGANDNKPVLDAALLGAAEAFAKASKATRTREAYALHWREFTAWCTAQQTSALPCEPQTLALYLTHLARIGRKTAGIKLALTAISQAHKTTGHPSPRGEAAVRLVWGGIRRELGTATEKKDAITIAMLQALVRATPPRKLIGVRDRALVLLGFASSFRRSEIANLHAEDITDDVNGLRVVLRRSKGDQEARGREVGIPYGSNPQTCPVRALRAWKEASGIEAGPIFVGMKHGKLGDAAMDDGAIARLLKKYAERAGIKADIAGHSLRAGLVTAAAQAGKSEHVIMQQTGHRDVATLRGYIRRATLFDDNAAAGIGL